jgi:ATP-dependent protease Clp ATPase subunit
MYDTPSQANISEVIINEDVIEKHAAPMVTYAKEAQTG